jgi:antitoxin VapB
MSENRHASAKEHHADGLDRNWRVGDQPRRAALLEDIARIRRCWNEMPVVDDRTPEEILGYDDRGLPG